MSKSNSILFCFAFSNLKFLDSNLSLSVLQLKFKAVDVSRAQEDGVQNCKCTQSLLIVILNICQLQIFLYQIL